MKVTLTRTKTERTVVDEKTIGETVDEWYLELDLEDTILGWESVGPLFEQLMPGNISTERQKQRQAEMVEQFLYR